MESWNRLVQKAATGIARAGEVEGSSGDDGAPMAVARLLQIFRARFGEAQAVSPRALLVEAAVLTLARRAGFSQLWDRDGVGGGSLWEHSNSLSPSPDQLSADTTDNLTEECPSTATARLVAILTDRLHLLPEWLGLLEKAGYRIPRVLLPEVLDLGHRHPELQLDLTMVLGGRGEWLARLNPDWAAMLERPQSGQNSEIPFSPEPELLRLLDQLIRFERRPLGRDQIMLRQPSEVEELQIRGQLEGFPRTASFAGPLTETSKEPPSPFEELLARIVPSFWCSHWEAEPTEIVAAAARSESGDSLLSYFTLAVGLYAAVEWVEPLLAERLREPTEEGTDIFSLLPPERQEHWILSVLRQSSSLEAGQPGYWLLTRSNVCWRRAVAQQLWPLMLEEVRHRPPPVLWDWRRLMKKAALCLDPALGPELAEYFPSEICSGSHLFPDLIGLIDDLAFREAMARELNRRPSRQRGKKKHGRPD
ncbi:MAG: hypothetical protein EBU88_14130 [Acidobacteria bacterium]|nr:hypothetical protein [Acidobacteriota bacterium]